MVNKLVDKEIQEAEIENLAKQAQPAPEPGLEEVKSGGKGDLADSSFTVAGINVSSAGWSIIYDTETGETSIVNNNALRAKLGQKRANGKPFFTTVRPNIIPYRGSTKCMLHTDGPNRKSYDKRGFPVCNKSNLTTEYQLLRHMQSKHKAEWAAIQYEKQEAEKKEDRELQRALLKMQTKEAGGEKRGRKPNK